MKGRRAASEVDARLFFHVPFVKSHRRPASSFLVPSTLERSVSLSPRISASGAWGRRVLAEDGLVGSSCTSMDRCRRDACRGHASPQVTVPHRNVMWRHACLPRTGAKTTTWTATPSVRIPAGQTDTKPSTCIQGRRRREGRGSRKIWRNQTRVVIEG